MKIGLFLPNATFDLPGTSEVGGIEVYALELGEQMQARCHEVTLFAAKPKPGRSHRRIDMSYQLFDHIQSKAIPKLVTRFRRLVQRLHFGCNSMQAFLIMKWDAVFVFKP